MRIREVTRAGGRIRLRVDAVGVAAPATEIECATSRGRLRVVGADATGLDLELPAAAAPVDVVATHTSGVAAWLRIR